MSSLFFFNDTATTEIYTLSLHDALPICQSYRRVGKLALIKHQRYAHAHQFKRANRRSEEHTSELQSQSNLVCRLLLEKKKTPVDRQSAPAERRLPDRWPVPDTGVPCPVS